MAARDLVGHHDLAVDELDAVPPKSRARWTVSRQVAHALEAYKQRLDDQTTKDLGGYHAKDRMVIDTLGKERVNYMY